jgi:hypothetical protein
MKRVILGVLLLAAGAVVLYGLQGPDAEEFATGQTNTIAEPDHHLELDLVTTMTGREPTPERAGEPVVYPVLAHFASEALLATTALIVGLTVLMIGMGGFELRQQA